MSKSQGNTYRGRAYVSEVGYQRYEVNNLGIILPPNEQALQHFYGMIGITPEGLPGTRSLDVLMRRDGTAEVGSFHRPSP